MIDFYVSGATIDVGRQGENAARNIYFDLSDLINIYGEGTPTLVHMRPSDQAPYVCETSVLGTFLVWTPSSTDTAFSGSGKCELRWVVGETLAKSIIYNTTILPSITGAEEVPSPYQSWYDAMIDFIRANMSGVPYDVRGAIYTLFSKAEYTETVDDELAVVEAWATAMMTVTNTLTNCTNSNPATMTPLGGSYTATLTAGLGYILNSVNVTMGGEDVTATVYASGTITIPSVTGDIVISATAIQAQYASIETDAEMLTISSGGTGILGVKLSEQPTQSQTVTLFSDTLTLSSASITFTTSNWNTYQYVTATAPSVDDTTYAYINLINSDPLMTETTVMVTVTGIGYDDLVDTTIPTEDMHTVTVDDFTSTSNYGDYIRLYGYNAEYENIKIPSLLNGKIPWVTCTNTSPTTANTTFSYGNTTIKYVTFEDGVIYRPAGTTSGISAEGLFKGCTNLIGVSNLNASVTSLKSAFDNCNALKFVDNLGNLANVTDLYQAFLGCTALEYIQDLSGITGSGLSRTFRGCTSLKKIFGLPQPSTAKAFDYAFMQTQVEKVIVPENASNLSYMFFNNTHVNHVTILADGLATSALTSIFGTPSQNIDVYANPNSTTLASLRSMFSSSTKVTVHEIGGSSLPSIVVWGDSTSSPNKPWVEWPARLQTKLGTSGYLVKNQAVSGEWTTSTSARQGGNVISTNAFQIPATTDAVLVTLTTADNQTFSNAPVFNTGGAFNPCKISGVDGTISKNGASYYFKRMEAGTEVSVPAGTTVVSDNDAVFNAAGNVMLVNIGHNAGWNDNAATLVNQMQLMVSHFLALGGTDYIITGPWSGTWISTSGGWAITQQVAALAAEAFGSHWLDLPGDIAAHCQEDNPSVEWTAEDLTYIAEGKTPLPSLTYDNTHPTEAGANSQMMAFYRKGVELGYWT